MRLRLFSTFALGFALGMATLTILLWATKSLYRPAAVRAEPGAFSAMAAGTSRQAALHKTGTLGMPVAGIDPAKLKSNFFDQRGGHRHEALDIMAPRGTPVLAVDDGNVAKLFTSKRGGLTVYQFDHAQDLCYYYAHLDRYAPELKQGTWLRRGEVLGYVGSTGDASPTAPHLHFAIFQLGPEREWWKGTAVDPLPLLQGGRP
jgi:peptidoglycan LD-endopeptidase LytH